MARLFLGLMGFAVGFLASAAEFSIFEDRFDGKLGDGWTWLREDASTWRLRDNALEIRVQPGDASTVKNALLRAAPDRARVRLAIEVTVSNATRPTQQFEQAGLTWYSGGKPVFKLVKELVDGQLMIIPGRKPMTAEKVQLRLVIEGEKLTAQFRPNAEGEWQIAATADLPKSGEDQVSLQCYHGPPDAEHWIRFDDFRIAKLLGGGGSARPAPPGNLRIAPPPFVKLAD